MGFARVMLSVLVLLAWLLTGCTISPRLPIVFSYFRCQLPFSRAKEMFAELGS
jgi:hypothetical protein